MNKVLRGLLRSVMWLVLLLAVYLAAVFLLPYLKSSGHAQSGQERITLYLRSNGVHTDIVVPTVDAEQDWSAVFPGNHTHNGLPERWLAIGWGDKNFYLNTPTWADLSAKTALKAAFGLSSAAIHTTYYADMEDCDRCAKLTVSREQYRALIRYIRASLQWQNGQTVWIETDSVYGRNDAFYEAMGTYHLFYSCNTWANNALKAMDADAALWTVTERGIFHHYPLMKPIW